MNRPEQRLQRQVAGYLAGHLAPPAFFTAIGHGSRGGGDEGWLRGIIAKSMGVKRNLPDLYFRRPGPGLIWPCFWIELKPLKRSVPKIQREFHDLLRSWGDGVAVARSLAEV